MDRYTSDPHEFWTSRYWVDDDEHDGFVFLGRAMLVIGQTLFREKWTGNEPEVVFPRPVTPLPKLPRPLLLPPIPRPVVSTPQPMAAPQPETIDTAPWWSPTLSSGAPDDQRPEARQQIVDEVDPFVAERRSRWMEVISATEWFLRRDILRSALRGLRGGSFLPLPRTHWNGEPENIRPRFLLCRMDYQIPFDRQPAGPAFIYVTASSLVPLVQALNQAHPDGPLMPGEQLGAETRRPVENPAQEVADASSLANRSRHSPKRAAMKKAVDQIWAGSLPEDIEIGPAVTAVMTYFRDQPSSLAKPPADYIRKHLNNLRSANRA